MVGVVVMGSQWRQAEVGLREGPAGTTKSTGTKGRSVTVTSLPGSRLGLPTNPFRVQRGAQPVVRIVER